MQDFLLELGFEELPARFIDSALKQLSEAITSRLTQERLSFGEVRLFSTPRRLAVLIEGLQEKQDDMVEEIKGPPVSIARDAEGNLTKAGLGFLRSQQVDEQAIIVKSFRGRYLYAQRSRARKPMRRLSLS